MIHGLSTSDLIVRVFPIVWECVNARKLTNGFRVLCDVVWWNAWNRRPRDRFATDGGEWVGERARVLIVGFFFVCQCGCGCTVFAGAWCLLILVLYCLEEYIHVEGLWGELREFEEECTPVANVRETNGLSGERVVKGKWCPFGLWAGDDTAGRVFIKALLAFIREVLRTVIVC